MLMRTNIFLKEYENLEFPFSDGVNSFLCVVALTFRQFIDCLNVRPCNHWLEGSFVEQEHLHAAYQNYSTA